MKALSVRSAPEDDVHRGRWVAEPGLRLKAGRLQQLWTLESGCGEVMRRQWRDVPWVEHGTSDDVDEDD